MQQLADNIIHAHAHYKEGTWKYQAIATLLFQTEDDHYRYKGDQYRNVEFKHILLLNADVPLMPRNGQFNEHNVKEIWEECITEDSCQCKTKIMRMDSVPRGSSSHSHDSHRTDEEQVWELVDKGLKTLVRHFREKYGNWKFISDADYRQETKDGTQPSDDSQHKSAREATGKKLHAEVTGI